MIVFSKIFKQFFNIKKTIFYIQAKDIFPIFYTVKYRLDSPMVSPDMLCKVKLDYRLGS